MPNPLPRITIVGLGPAGPELVSDSARSALQQRPAYLRTRHHPAALIAPDAITFDDIYDSAETIESVYPRICESLIEAAHKHGHITYGVPGSPLIAEATVDYLRARDDVNLDIIPAMSFLDLVWNALSVDPLVTSPRLIDGRRFAEESAGERGPLLVAQCDAPWVLSDIKLAYEEETPESVTVLQRLGLSDQSVTTIPWEDLDRVVEPDHLTTLWISEVTTPVAFELARVESVARRLRRDCPWDAKQTHKTLSRYLLEETYELLEAIDAHSDDDDEHLIEELGDVLFQVFAHAAIASEAGRFNVADVAKGVSDKLIERHPHVYGDVVAETAEAVAETWEANKMAKKGRTSAMEGIPPHLPALLYARKVMRKAASVGIQPDSAELTHVEDVGRVLFEVAATAIPKDIDPEEALRHAVVSFREHFERYEVAAVEKGLDLKTMNESERVHLWQEAGQPHP